jgi:hypothetical protein
MNTKANLSHVAQRVVNRTTDDPKKRKSLLARLSKLKASSFRHDNFTVVTLSTESGRVAGAGASKRSPTDPLDEAIGFNLALIRAVEGVVQSYLAV